MANPGDYKFVSGPYTAIYSINGVDTDIGQSKNGFTVETIFHTQDVFVDEYGMGPVEKIQLGCSIYVHWSYAEYDRIHEALMRQYGKNGIDLTRAEGNIWPMVGRRLTTYGGQLILTPMIRPNDRYTFYMALPDDNLKIYLGSPLREGPISFQCYPKPGSIESGTNPQIGNQGVYYTIDQLT